MAKRNRTVKKETKPSGKKQEEIVEDDVIKDMIGDDITEEEEEEEEEEETLPKEVELDVLEGELEIPVETEILYKYTKKNGSSFFISKNKIVKPNEEFWFPKSRMPQSLSDLFTVLDERPIQENYSNLGKGLFVAQETEDGDWAIFNKETGKQISVPFSKAEAEKITAELNS